MWPVVSFSCDVSQLLYITNQTDRQKGLPGFCASISALPLFWISSPGAVNCYAETLFFTILQSALSCSSCLTAVFPFPPLLPHCCITGGAHIAQARPMLQPPPRDIKLPGLELIVPAV